MTEINEAAAMDEQQALLFARDVISDDEEKIDDLRKMLYSLWPFVSLLARAALRWREERDEANARITELEARDAEYYDATVKNLSAFAEEQMVALVTERDAAIKALQDYKDSDAIVNCVACAGLVAAPDFLCVSLDARVNCPIMRLGGHRAWLSSTLCPRPPRCWRSIPTRCADTRTAAR